MDLLYNTLNIPIGSDGSVVKKAYRELAKVFHPDKGGDVNNFQSIERAYNHLTAIASLKKQREIEYLSMVKSPLSVKRINITLESFFTGITRSIQLEQTKKCVDCFGYKNVSLKRCSFCMGNGCKSCKSSGECTDITCTSCNGLGFVTAKRCFQIVIPPGSVNGFSVLLEDAGSDSKEFRAGDIQFVVFAIDHPRFSRVNNHLHITVSLDLATALVGGVIQIPCLSGERFNLNLEKGVTRPGDTIVIPGKGISKIGDLIIHFEVEFPSDSWCFNANANEVRKLLNLR